FSQTASHPALGIFCMLAICCALPCPAQTSNNPQSPIRNPQLTVALIFEGDGAGEAQNALSKSLEASGFNIQDELIVESAKKALQLPLQNLTRKQAQNFGLALGVDLFVTSRIRSIERTAEGGKLYGECFAALCCVGARSGKLITFDFIETSESTAQA